MDAPNRVRGRRPSLPAWILRRNEARRVEPLQEHAAGPRMLQCEERIMTTMTVTERHKLGLHGPEVSPIALGCMGMSGMYGPADEPECLATIHAAIDAGINLLDTGDFYGMGHNEMLVG